MEVMMWSRQEKTGIRRDMEEHRNAGHKQHARLG
jgi:hypothetical protein